ncbi:Diamine acetyltransferase [Phaffia rhodozyma]|uniref:Diamine acetyltransferase n=1 Tax=Phaffia rhodozyma TaxID=264483 RepID=A0A0F7SQT5_PHARH|nr:Diamine acetyltransferase [Phaffia rhodozyma]
MSSNAFHISPATEADIPDILRLILELAIYEKSAESAKATPEQIRRNLFPKESDGEIYARCLIARLDNDQDGNEGTGKGLVIGMALFFFNFSTWTGFPGLYLEDLFVSEPYRALGVGKSFFKELAKVALERGCGRMDWSVLDWNEPAINFYEKKVGATIMNEWRSVRLEGEDAIRGLLTMS